jgi:hypothetical protein
MNRKGTALIPEAITQLQRQLEQFRSSQSGRTKLPESLWQAAVELARQYGIYAVAHPLRLDYTRLKQRLAGIASPTPKGKGPAFIELMGRPPAVLPECVIEFESASGSKMRVQWKAAVPPDWASLLRAWIHPVQPDISRSQLCCQDFSLQTSPRTAIFITARGSQTGRATSPGPTWKGTRHSSCL